MDWPVFLAAGLCLGGLVEAIRCPDWTGRITAAACWSALAAAIFWAASSGWLWAIVALVVVGWLAWCALRLVVALVT